MATKIVYDLVQASDIERAFEIETAGFPEDEAASFESLQYRQRHAGDYFLGAYEVEPSSDGSSRRLLIGYTCATLTRQPTLTHDAMSTHEPEGTHVAIHSVCVAPSHRQRGIATALLREYLARLDQAGQQQQQQSARSRIESALLIAHPELVPLYERAGFTVVGPSAVVHGAKPWVELKRDLLSKPVASSSSSAAASSSSSSAGPSTTTPQATEAPPAQEEEEEEGEVRSPGRLLGYFKGGMADLVDPKDGTNKVNLYCPRAECRCLLLRAGAGTWVQGTTKHDIEAPCISPNGTDALFGRLLPPATQLPDLPRPISAPPPPKHLPASQRGPGYWSVSSPLAFENIGFSRNAAAPSSSSSSPSASAPAAAAGNIKYLTCADCDHGPLGWHDTEGRDLGLEVQAENEAREGSGAGPAVRKGREFLLAVDRVRYKV